MRMLENEGFSWEKYVDIFDGGPTMTVRTDQIRSIREAQDVHIAEISAQLGEQLGGEKKLITVGRLGNFKAAYGWTLPHDNGVVLDEICAATLGLSVGDSMTQVARW
jgi:arginine N-succinyltransferase